jgi:hypothetical protein
MKTKEEVLRKFDGAVRSLNEPDPFLAMRLQLEVLLDVRDLLKSVDERLSKTLLVKERR